MKLSILKKRSNALLVSAFLILLAMNSFGAEEQVLFFYTDSSIEAKLTGAVAEHLTGYPVYLNSQAYPAGRPWIKDYATGNYTSLTARPPVNDYHNVWEWYSQRYLSVMDHQGNDRNTQKNWSAYNYLRFDVCSDSATAILGLLVKDASGVKLTAGYRGKFTPVSTFRVPAGAWYTCNYPLKEIADIGELDLSKMQGFFLKINGWERDTKIQFKKIRLVGSGTPDLPVIEMEEAVRPFGRKVCKEDTLHVSRDAQQMVRALGPVSPLGPVTVVNVPGVYACALGHFGGNGGTYYQTLRRGVSAYDNNRIMFLLKASYPSPIVSGSSCEGGGILAMGSFDGGATWGGITEGETRPTQFNNWYWRGTSSADYISGDVYHIGTQNCSSYHGCVDLFFRRLIFTGNGWKQDRFSILDQIQKCPGVAQAMRLPSGRIWAIGNDGWGGNIGKSSEDDGFTFGLTKDASLTGSTQNPRPWYRPGVDAVPDSVLNFPGEEVPGPYILPYGHNGVAVFSGGTTWKIHDGTSWINGQTLPTWGTGSFSATSIIDDNRFFLAKGGSYNNTTGPGPTRLSAINFTKDGTPKLDTLEKDSVVESILSASGNAVFCFYVKLNSDSTWTVKYRKWKDNVWAPAVDISIETERVSRLAAPNHCPPTYACVFWDKYGGSASIATWVKFAKIPVDLELTIATISLGNGVKDAAYSSLIQAAGGTAPYVFSLMSGTLPEGLSMNDSGYITGIPVTVGTFAFTVKVTDNNSDTLSKAFTLVIDATSGVFKNDADAITASSLISHLPNPFTYEMTIKYQLAQEGNVSLRIYNIKGALVKTVLNVRNSVGIHTVRWQPKGLTPGLYFVKFQSGRNSSVQKIMLIR